MNVPAIDLIFSEIKTPQALKALATLAGLSIENIHEDIKEKYISIIMDFLKDKELNTFLVQEKLSVYINNFNSINKNWIENFPFVNETKSLLMIKFVNFITSNFEQNENGYHPDNGFSNTTIFELLFNNPPNTISFTENEEKVLFENLKKNVNSPIINILYDNLGHLEFLKKLEKYNTYELLKSHELIKKILKVSDEKEIWELFNKNKNILNLYGMNISITNKISDDNKINEIKIHNTLLDIKKSDLLKSELKNRLKNIPDWKKYKSSDGNTTYHFIAAKNLSYLNSEANTTPELLVKRLSEKNNMGQTPIDIFLRNLTVNAELTTQLTEKMKEVLRKCEHSKINFSLDNLKIGLVNLKNIINIFSNINLSFEDSEKFRKNYNFNVSYNDLSERIDYSILSDIASDSAIAFLISLKVNADLVERLNPYSEISLSKGNIDLVSVLIPSLDIERKNNIHFLLLKHYEKLAERKVYLTRETQKEILSNLKTISNVVLETKIIKNILVNDENIENKRKRI